MMRALSELLTPSIPKLILFAVLLLVWAGGESQARAFSEADVPPSMANTVPAWELWVAVSAPLLWAVPNLTSPIDIPVLGAYYYLVACLVLTCAGLLWRGLRGQRAP